jgi:hypothetical protein
MLKTIVAIERDGLDVRVLALNFDVPSADFDLKSAIKAACTEYCQTEAGRQTYEYNCSSFNWADFAMSVPAEICEKHGFKLIQSDVADEDVDWDEELVNSDDVYEDDEDEKCKGCSGCDGTQCTSFGCDCMGCTGNC